MNFTLQTIPTTLTISEIESPISDNRILVSVKNLLRLTSDLNTWTSKFVVTHSETSIDVSCAAQGALSSSPSGIYPPQNIPYPFTKYYFDENLFKGIGDKDLLIKMIKSPNCVDGCKIISRRHDNKKTQFRKGAWTFVCSHGLVANEIVHSHFHPDSVGKSHVPIPSLKRTKSRGCAVKGTKIYDSYEFILSMNSYRYEFISLYYYSIISLLLTFPQELMQWLQKTLKES